MTDAFLTVAGVRFPYPNRESGLQTQSTYVDNGKNARGVFIGQRVGRDQSKVELQWASMDAQTWAALLRLFQANFVNTVEYYDMTEGKVVSRRMYVSDRTAQPKRIDPATGVWLEAKNCKLNLIDTGE
jgi:hypothetical protein